MFIIFIVKKCYCENPKNILCGSVDSRTPYGNLRNVYLGGRCNDSTECIGATIELAAVEEIYKWELCFPKGRFECYNKQNLRNREICI